MIRRIVTVGNPIPDVSGVRPSRTDRTLKSILWIIGWALGIAPEAVLD